MSADLNKRLAQLEEKLNNQKAILYGLNQLVKKQAIRALKLQNQFNFNNNQQQMFSKIFGSHNSQIYKDYSKLLSKQISDKVAQYLKDIQQIRLSLSKVSANIKGNKNQQATKTIQSGQKRLEELGQKVSAFWHEQSYLIANYRLDIVGKQLEKWNRGILMSQSSFEVKKQINELFN